MNNQVKVKNTAKVRAHQLENKVVEILGQRSGKVYFSKLGDTTQSKVYSIENEAFATHFEFVGDTDQIHTLSVDIFEKIRKNVMRF